MLQRREIGDTLILTHHLLPDWKEGDRDTFIATKEGKFSFCKQTDETKLYIITYHPSQTEPLRYCNRGFVFYARPGDHLKVKWNVDFLPCTKRAECMMIRVYNAS